MAFGRVFERAIVPQFGGFAAAVSPWYLDGGIASANCIAAYQPVGAASLAASYVNLANPGTYNAAPGSAPTWNTTDGWIFNGSSQYLTTGITPVIQTWSVLVQFTNAVGVHGIFGSYLSTGFGASFQIIPLSGGTRVDYVFGGLGAKAPQFAAGNLGFAGNKAYRNGADEGITIPGASGTLATIYVGGINSMVGIVDYFPGYIRAFAIYNTTITPTQVAAVAARMAVLPL